MSLEFGKEIPGSFQALASFVALQISLSSDLAGFLTERAELEREYAGKLSLLCKKAKEKRDKRLQEYVVGAEPTKAWTKETADRSTLQTFVTTLLGNQEGMANAHKSLADALESVASDLSAAERKQEATRKKHVAFSSRAIADREKVYSDRQKSKEKYYEACHEVDAQRHKREKADAGDKQADRAAKAQAVAEVDLKNAKNTYLISICVANKAKELYFKRTTVALQNDLQSLWGLSISRLASRLRRANEHLLTHTDRLRLSVTEATDAFSKVSIIDDQRLYVEYNRRRCELPADWTLEPCVGFFDTGEMSIEDATARTFLQNRLLKARQKARDVRPMMESRRKEVQGLQNLRDAYAKQEGLGDPDEVMDNLLESSRELLVLETSEGCLQAEEDIIIASIGADHVEARPHRFKPASFTIPTSCDFCSGTIWGIAKQGLVCKPCGFTVHAKCELKVPADCGSSSNSTHATRNGLAPPTRATASATHLIRVPGSVDSTSVGASAGTSISDTSRGRLLYSFEATSPFELTVTEGELVRLVEEDLEGTGWIKVATDDDRQGLVPTSYCEFVGSRAVKANPTLHNDEQLQSSLGGMAFSPAQDTQTFGAKYVRALYDFEASDPQEMSLKEGEVIQLSDVGMDFGEGWAEGVRMEAHHGHGGVGIFPVNYVEAA
ncbi:hypothetical protein K437DRAFT_253195 [Tilletiaria anomala UBC 951]|uniref:FCH-domain-containing protein n=1 Tax=Tilletiaria anomala (strain ATCC 24038 / CBS 436.72 / UBC 951) TaxID=1037660 RepID=A0A066WGQ6_TILAU|nr:uncharacterized protein K437DRAFT_253195 [Tilletiaria anomala UBC 951]KDN53182.1 hypothetical protein K437DRAFT_253195 [Tilletiaria anomala UBC 951]